MSTSSSHPQLVKTGTSLDSFWTNKLLLKVKSSHPHEHESLREEATKLYKTLMMHGLDISVTRDKIYEVLDIAKILIWRVEKVTQLSQRVDKANT